MASPKQKNIIAQLKGLRGSNALPVVLFEPTWSIPYGLYSFYLSLYMKSQGVTDVQIGFLISLNFIVGTVTALFAGVVADKLGRRKGCVIFSVLSWPGSVLLNLLARGFWGFALAQTVCAFGKISDISWQLTTIEDANDEQRLTAFNLFGIIDILSGFVTPIAGIVVANMGLVAAERTFLLISFFVMGIGSIWRYFCVKETAMGRIAMAESRSVSYWGAMKRSLSQMKGALLGGNRRLQTVLAIIVLFYAYQPIGAFSSLYFAPYLTDVVGLDTAVISILGTVNSLVMLAVYLFLIPALSGANKLFSLIVGLSLQILSMLSRVLIPHGSFGWTVVSVGLFDLGFGLCRPFLDALMAEATPDADRAGVYALKNLLISLFSALAGSLSGFLYQLNPDSIYLASVLILAASIALICIYSFRSGPEPGQAMRSISSSNS